MRLGQLSRQLNISSDQIVAVLQENFREVNNHPNIKITEEELEFLNNRFAPEIALETIPTETEEPTEKEIIEPAEEEVTIQESEVNAPQETPEFVESLRPQVISLEEEFHAQTESLETYKAEKPHLEGLKVVGKIELPEPVVKEKEEEPVEKTSKKPRADRSSKPRRRRTDRKQNSLAEEREKAKRLAIKKKFEEEEKLKKLKKKHYEENVRAKMKPSTPKKKKTKVADSQTGPAVPYSDKSKATPTVNSKPQKDKNPLKRFWLWLNGAYDN
ncbi:hypothetical protein [Roseivirga misakiensis]|uniref:Translation initiation factor IF-2 N-terminal domain-containing protein n=1 Tax=Roseivirga misakiensis TaxID=1563681 RepID=A0A1E5SZX8_9BACT|nr:hypothetical protein [Roseivirga misakiensis]OEK04688.1 hypothetical protein BFP71_14650 [Roseivirga misakiensis]